MLLCSHSEADNINRADGAFGMAFAAADALFIIDLCTEAVNRYRSLFARLDALHTAYATRLTFLAGYRALIVVFAEHGCLCFLKRHHFDKPLGTGFNALAAGAALKGINSRNAVANAYRAVFTRLNAVAEADTAVNTFLRSAENLRCHFTAFNTLIFKLDFCVYVMTLAENDCRRRLNLACGKPCYLTDGFGGFVAAGSTESRVLRFSL